MISKNLNTYLIFLDDCRSGQADLSHIGFPALPFGRNDFAVAKGSGLGRRQTGASRCSAPARAILIPS